MERRPRSSLSPKTYGIAAADSSNTTISKMNPICPLLTWSMPSPPVVSSYVSPDGNMVTVATTTAVTSNISLASYRFSSHWAYPPPAVPWPGPSHYQYQAPRLPPFNPYSSMPHFQTFGPPGPSSQCYQLAGPYTAAYYADPRAAPPQSGESLLLHPQLQGSGPQTQAWSYGFQQQEPAGNRGYTSINGGDNVSRRPIHDQVT